MGASKAFLRTKQSIAFALPDLYLCRISTTTTSTTTTTIGTSTTITSTSTTTGTHLQPLARIRACNPISRLRYLLVPRLFFVVSVLRGLKRAIFVRGSRLEHGRSTYIWMVTFEPMRRAVVPRWTKSEKIVSRKLIRKVFRIYRRDISNHWLTENLIMETS